MMLCSVALCGIIIWIPMVLPLNGYSINRKSVYPVSEYEYSMNRDSLKEYEREWGPELPVLTQDEKIVDSYLDYLRWRDFEETRDGNCPAYRPIEETLDFIRNSTLFHTLKTLPKGGNMHTHEDHQLGRRILVDLLFDCEDFQYLYIDRTDFTLDFFINPPTDRPWEKVKDNPGKYTREYMTENLTLIGVMSDEARRYVTDTALRWKNVDLLWGRSPGALGNLPIKKQFLWETMRTSLEEGVQYLETLGSWDQGIYVLDRSGEHNATNGKRYLDSGEGDYEMTLCLELIRNFTTENPSFIGWKRVIYNTRKATDQDSILQGLKRAHRLKETFPNHVIGYDLVGEEDDGNSLLFFLEAFQKFREGDGEIRDLPLWFHSGETNWADQLITANFEGDLVGTAENIYDALLLQTKRIGHGLALQKRPYLLKQLVENNIAIESCPVSNMILAYYPDTRNHPAINWLRNGIPVVLGSDDAGSFGYDDFTVDWYMVHFAWGLDLTYLKKLAHNSILFSGMDNTERQTAITQWKQSWDAYIGATKKKACDFNVGETAPMFSRILPSDGAVDDDTDVHVYGRDFQRGICQEIICKFGEKTSTGEYMTNNHIKCRAPVPSLHQDVMRRPPIEGYETAPLGDKAVPVFVSFNAGMEYLETGFNFTYRHSAPTTTPPTVSSAHQWHTDIFLMVSIILNLIRFM